MEDSRLVGRGRMADVYLYDENEIIKVLHKDFPKELLEFELNINQIINQNQLPSPKVVGLTTWANRVGLIFERIQGPTLMGQLFENPNHVEQVGKIMGKLHSEIHQAKSKELPNQKDKLIEAIEGLPENVLSRLEKNVVKNYLKTLPSDQCICHGDFHPENILVEEKRYVVIDWLTARSGNPACDVARTMVILKYAVLPEDIPDTLKSLFEELRERLVTAYLNSYMNLTEMTLASIEAWEVPVMAARLSENLPDNEKHRLRKHLQQALLKIKLI